MKWSICRPTWVTKVLCQDDKLFREAVLREGAGSFEALFSEFGRKAGSVSVFEKADQANRFPPHLKAFDRYGMRINQVVFHPA